MNKLTQTGGIIFALGIIALGVLQFLYGDFAIGRPPAYPADLAGKEVWAYVSGVIIILSGIGILLNRSAANACLLLGAIVLIYSFFLRHFAEMIHDTANGNLWRINAFKTLALIGSLFIVGATLPGTGRSRRILNSNFIYWMSLIFLAYFFVICGFAHFKFFDFVKTMIPAYFPATGFWVTFAGIALMATGLGILLPFTRRWAALAAGIMILLWFFMVHLHRATASPKEYSEWMGVCESFSLSGLLFVLAGTSPSRTL